MGVQAWIAEGVNADSYWYWFLATAAKFCLEGLLAAVLGTGVTGVLLLLTAAVSPGIPAIVGVSTGIPYQQVTPIVAWVLLSGLILREFIWCRLDEKVET